MSLPRTAHVASGWDIHIETEVVAPLFQWELLHLRVINFRQGSFQLILGSYQISVLI